MAPHLNSNWGSYSDHSPPESRPTSSLSYYSNSSESQPNSRRQSIIGSLKSKASFASIASFATTNTTHSTNTSYTTYSTQDYLGAARRTPSNNHGTNLRRQVNRHSPKDQIKQQQKKALPLFPTVRTRGNTSVHNVVLPVDVSQIELMPIEFSHKIIMNCIDELKLRGLKHKYLFRNAFYSPAVEAALKLMAKPKTHQLVSVKMLRLDTVAGLLTTALSRTNPPLIPAHIQELFLNPEEYFFFEVLGMLPELNRYLFVEILDLCCDLVDNQSINSVGHSKLAIYPGSCCFGLGDTMPTWDTRYLLTEDRERYSHAFYKAIYAYREERDLSAAELQCKLDLRDRAHEQQHIEALHREHGYEGAQAILRMEARLTLGLEAESPELQPTDLKEISLYADRKEIVVADDAISVLEMELDDEARPLVVPDLDRVEEEDVEDEQVVLLDLRKSISVATLVSPYHNHRSMVSLLSSSTTTDSTLSPSSSSTTIATPPTTNSKETLNRVKSMIRLGSFHRQLPPVLPGDLFGFSRRALEQQEMQRLLAAARVVKRKPVPAKILLLVRQQSRRQKQSEPLSPRECIVENTHSMVLPKQTRSRPLKAKAASPTPKVFTHWKPSQTTFQTVAHPATLPSLFRTISRRLSHQAKTHQAKGLSEEEAVHVREARLKKQRQRREERTKLALIAVAKAQEEAALVAAKNAHDAVTIEEAEILEALDYLSDKEFEEFMELAGLTMPYVQSLMDKAAARALDKVTLDIQAADKTRAASTSAAAKRLSMRPTTPVPVQEDKDDSLDVPQHHSTEETKRGHRKSLLLHMTSMDLLIKNTTAIGDGNLRCYPTRPSSPEVTLLGSLEKENASPAAAEETLSSEAVVVVAEAEVTLVVGHAVPGSMEEEKETIMDESMESKSFMITKAIPYVLDTTMDSAEQITDKESNISPFKADEVQEDASMTDEHQVPDQEQEQEQEQEQYPCKPVSASVSAHSSTVFEFDTVIYKDEVEAEAESEQVDHVEFLQVEEEDEEEAELRELLESMTEEERLEFLRLSTQEAVPMVTALFGEPLITVRTA